MASLENKYVIRGAAIIARLYNTSFTLSETCTMEQS